VDGPAGADGVAAAAVDAAAPAAEPETSAALADWIRGPLVFRGVSVRWQDARGDLQASVSGMDVIWMSMVTPTAGGFAPGMPRGGNQDRRRSADHGAPRGIGRGGRQRFLVALDARTGAARSRRPRRRGSPGAAGRPGSTAEIGGGHGGLQFSGGMG
jgi:hypothetical protein